MKDLSEALRRPHQFRLHPLGFFYLQEEAGQGITRRVHVWLDDDEDHGKNDRHLHSYDILSHVVTGALCSELYRFDPTTDGTVSEFVVSYQGDESVSQPTGRRGVLLTEGYFETTVGASYWLKAGVIHRVRADVRPCVTVVRTSERGVPICVYGSDNEKRPFARRMVTPEEAGRIAAIVGETGCG